MDTQQRPRICAPIGMNRVQAADHIGVSTTLFEEMVKDGRMPKPKRANTKPLWNRIEIERAFEDLPEPEEKDPTDPWDTING